jgi:hypothetical protein
MRQPRHGSGLADLAVLDLRDVGLLQAGAFGEVSLRQLAHAAGKPKALSERF